MDAFESPKFLVRQTRENLAELDRLCNALFTRDHSRRIVEVDPKTGNKTFKIVFDAVVPDRARHIAASAINDLRHALDQAACAAVESITGRDPGKLYFPIAASPNDLDGRLSKEFPPEIWPAFRAFQSYPTGQCHSGGNDLICALAKAAQRKHRISCKIGAFTIGVEFGRIIVTGSPGSINVPVLPEWDIAKNEMLLGTVGPDGNLQHDVNVAFYIALYEAGPLTSQPAITTLSQLTTEVGNIVGAIEAETARVLRARSP